MIALCVASKSGTLPGGTAHLAPYVPIVNSRAGWAEAANATLDAACDQGLDAVFADDDVFFTPGCMDAVYARGIVDVAGWRLDYPGGGTQSGAHHTLTADGVLVNHTPAVPAYVAHCSTSAIFIAHRVLAAGVRFPVWPGLHCEDVVFCIEAWLHGFSVISLTHPVLHALTGAGVGQTKIADPDLGQRLMTNYGLLRDYLASDRVRAGLANGTIPIGAQLL